MSQQNVSHDTNPATKSSPAIPPLLIAECKADRVLTKRFLADGTKIDFQAGKWFKYHEIPVTTLADLVDVLEMLTDQPNMCVLRGVLDPEFPRGDDAPWYSRRKLDRPGEPAALQPGSFPWLVFDFDDTVAPFDIEKPVQSVRAWHTTLKSELRAAGSAFFLSASAHTSATVRGKLVTWYRGPVSEAQAVALALYYGADASVARCYQPNYFAAPIFEGGARDPLSALRHQPIMFEGPPAHMPNRAEMKTFKERDAPVRLVDCPPGDKGILAALGPAEALVGSRFHIAGHLGGIMRKLGYPREACAAILTEWIPAKELAPRLKWALGAWDKEPDAVSGIVSLRLTVGEAHEKVILAACLAARGPVRFGGAK